MKKKETLYFSLMALTIAIFYFGFTAFNVTFLWSLDDNIKRLQQFIAMILSGVIGYFIFKPIIYKKFLGSRLKFVHTIILAVLVANVFRAAVTPFSLGYISLMLGTLYLIFKEN